MRDRARHRPQVACHRAETIDNRGTGGSANGIFTWPHSIRIVREGVTAEAHERRVAVLESARELRLSRVAVRDDACNTCNMTRTASVAFIVWLSGCSSNPAHCASTEMGFDRQGNCVPLCAPNSAADAGRCPSGSTCESIGQPGNPDNNLSVSAFVCCAGDGC